MTARRVSTSTSTQLTRAVARTAGPDDLRAAARLLGPWATEDALGTFVRHGGEVTVVALLGEVAGVAVLEWLHPVQRPGAEAWLTALVTDASVRHQGLARTLLGAVALRVRQAGGACLRVACPVEADDARAFFCATGFEARLIVFERLVG